MTGHGLSWSWLSERLDDALAHDDGLTQGQALTVAYSGGADSTALLHLCVQLCEYRSLTCQAIHINHQLSAQSDHWQAACQQQCDSLGIALLTRSVDVQDPDSSDSLETRCRDARYLAFGELLPANSLLLLAHHQQDQAETLLLNLCRGSGIRGLGGMPIIRSHQQIWIWRPLLDRSREQLLSYCQEWGLEWVDDPSNLDHQHRRNYLRHQVLPLLRGPWPGVDQTLTRCAELMQAHDAVHHALVDEALKSLMDNDRSSLDLDALGLRPVVIWLPIIRRWLWCQGLPLPSRLHGEELIRQLREASDDSALEVNWPGTRVTRYRQRLMAHSHAAIIDPETLPIIVLKGQQTDLPHPLGRLEWLALSAATVDHYPELDVVFISAESRIRLAGCTHSSRIRTLFQDAGIPPSERRLTPRLYENGRLLCIGDRWKTDAMRSLEQRLKIELRWFRETDHFEYNARH